MVYPASFFSTFDSKKYLMIHSSVAFAVPEYSLKRKRFAKAVTLAICLYSSKNFRSCKELVEKY